MVRSIELGDFHGSPDLQPQRSKVWRMKETKGNLTRGEKNFLTFILPWCLNFLQGTR